VAKSSKGATSGNSTRHVSFQIKMVVLFSVLFHLPFDALLPIFFYCVSDRFRILAGIEDGSNYNGSTSHRHHRRHHYGDMADIRLYEVEELNEANLPLPPVSLRHMTCFASHSGTGNNANDAAEDIGSSMFLERQSRMRDTLASVSPLPAFAYQIVWPWRLMDLVQHALSDTSGWDGVKRYNQDGSRDGIPQNPTQFSFWVAANMPLSEAEKLELLDMNCTVKRLRFLYEKLLEEKRNMRSIFCKRCGTRISNVASMFTVSGAEGTTGAYGKNFLMVMSGSLH